MARHLVFNAFLDLKQTSVSRFIHHSPRQKDRKARRLDTRSGEIYNLRQIGWSSGIILPAGRFQPGAESISGFFPFVG